MLFTISLVCTLSFQVSNGLQTVQNFSEHLVHNGLAESLLPLPLTKQWPMLQDFMSLLDEFLPLEDRTNYVVNIGARDGIEFDPTWELFSTHHFGGIAIEGEVEVIDKLNINMQRCNQTGNIHVISNFTFEHTIAEQLRSKGCPVKFDVLKVDIDSLDVGVTRGLLQGGYQPGIIMVEINPGVPPPLEVSIDSLFMNNTLVKLDYRNHGGASIGAWYSFFTEMDYVLVGVELGSPRSGRCRKCEHNAYFVRGSFFRKASMKGYTAPSYTDMIRAYWQGMYFYNKGNPALCNCHPCPIQIVMNTVCNSHHAMCPLPLPPHNKINVINTGIYFANTSYYLHSVEGRDVGKEAEKQMCDVMNTLFRSIGTITCRISPI